ncbi:MAG: GNAT family N-acetyltransferase [Rudaea sp.]|nr:GNAT family N-acetyltransferase [Rudaea sp.]
MNSPAAIKAELSPSLHIRCARETDAAILCAAERETARVPGRLLSQPQELHEAAFARKIDELAGAGSYLVVERGGTIVAHGLLEPAGTVAALAHVRTLTIVVHPGHTGQGTGRVLLRALLNWARANASVERIELRVRAGNEAAIRLYTTCGFREESRFRKRVRLADGSYADDIGMTWFSSQTDGSVS